MKAANNTITASFAISTGCNCMNGTRNHLVAPCDDTPKGVTSKIRSIIAVTYKNFDNLYNPLAISICAPTIINIIPINTKITCLDT